MTENEFILFDRLEVIRKTIEKEGEEKFYLSFSGGKDSTVVHYLLDMALPDNKIPRVFFNTGIEYNHLLLYVKELQKTDERIDIVQPTQNIREMLERVGYPFKSKEHSLKMELYKRGSRSKSVMLYKEGFPDRPHGSKFQCPEGLKYQYNDDFKLHISPNCCTELKKKPVKKWAKEHGRSINITGMMREEGGHRTTLDCIVVKNNEMIKFHPLAKVTADWEKWFIKEHNVKLCDLYYEPFNFERTGCKGCPFAQDLAEQLATMELYLPNERRQCEYIWKPVYDEYRRIGYRLSDEENLKLF